MKGSGGNNTPLEITALTGKFYQTSFEYAGQQFWIGVDYYPVSGGYQVSYKVGLAGSWFATSVDPAVPVMYDEIINCTAADIEDIILKNIEEKKRRLLSAA